MAIQRYQLFDCRKEETGEEWSELKRRDDGPYVLFTDHQAALDQARKEGAEAERERLRTALTTPAALRTGWRHFGPFDGTNAQRLGRGINAAFDHAVAALAEQEEARHG